MLHCGTGGDIPCTWRSAICSRLGARACGRTEQRLCRCGDAAGGAGPSNVSGLGTYAAGSGPVIAADGTVYLGNQQGQLIALQADGTRKWAQGITPGFAIVAAPVVDSEGSVYVIGTRTIRNEQANPPLTRYDSSLYKFTPAGQMALARFVSQPL
jgi:hypothetical protein